MYYACYCRPGAVLNLVRELQSIGVKAESPAFQFRRRSPRRKQTVLLEKPLISGMFFLAVDEWPMSQGIVAGVTTAEIRRMRCQGEPAVIQDHELDRLRQAATTQTTIRSKLRVGDVVAIDLAQFEGYQGLIVRKRGERATIQIHKFGGQLDISTLFLRKL